MTDDESRRWIVLHPEEYDNVGLGTEGNLAVLVDLDQAGEVFRLAAQAIAALSHKDADGDNVIRAMIKALEDLEGSE